MEGQHWLKKRAMLSFDDEYSDEMTVDFKTQQAPGLR